MKEMIYTEEKKDEFVSLASQHEDNVLKFMMQFFSEDILPFLGIEGKVVSAAPTESIHLELKKMFDDFNDRESWYKKELVNIAKAGYFSSDRTIEQYNKDIWKLK